MLIAQISDTHIVIDGACAYGVAPTSERLERCVLHINEQKPPVDIVLVTGDICNSALEDEAKHAVEILSALNCPYFIIPGNHDSREVLKAVFDARTYPSCHSEFFDYVIDDYPLRLIALDSLDEGKPGGKFTEERAYWLNDRLAEDIEKPTIIFLHHPPVKCGVIETDVDGFEGAELLGDVVSCYSNIERVLCGHIHLSIHLKWKGTAVTAAPSTGMKLVLDLTMSEPSQFVVESPAYLLHHWTSEKNLITHRIEVRDTDCRHLFT